MTHKIGRPRKEPIPTDAASEIAILERTIRYLDSAAQRYRNALENLRDKVDEKMRRVIDEALQ